MALNEKLRKLWKAAGYERGHGSDAVCPPAPAGFKRLYYLTGPEHAVSNIVFGRLKISRFSELNDPFELLGQNFADRAVREIVREHKHEFNEQKGVICFSEDWVDPVLWSHYAARHRGVALGFDVDRDWAKEVQYSAARLKLTLAKGAKTITDELANFLVFTKYESWRYEREWRVICELKRSEQEGGLYFAPFDKKLKLTEVILGPLCDLDLTRIRTLVDYHHDDAITYKARLAFRSFRIIPLGSSVTLASGHR